MSELYVGKFGGSSLADSIQARKVIDITRSDQRRRAIVVSAPGRRHASDEKVTDLLIAYRGFLDCGLPSYTGQIGKVVARFQEIAAGIGSTFDEAMRLSLYRSTGDVLVSLGEQIMGRLMAEALGFAYLDAAAVIKLDTNGRLDMQASIAASKPLVRAANTGVVVPGFYGSMPDGSIRTFSRGGSDISGAIVAAILGATVYENWTDVDGILMTDPAVVRNPEMIGWMSYQEMRELAYAGARVLHDDAVFPARNAGIPIHVRNTNAPERRGTYIDTQEKLPSARLGSITGIATRKGFTVISLEKAGMNDEVGFAWKLLGILRDQEVRFDHMPGSIDGISLAIDDRELDGKLESVLDGIRKVCEPDKLVVKRDVALICTVGRGMAQTPGVLAKLASAYAEAGVNIVFIDQGASEISIIIAVSNDDCEKAVQAIYAKFVQE